MKPGRNRFNPERNRPLSGRGSWFAGELAFVLVFALFGASPTTATQQETRVGEISVRADVPWPSTVSRGYFPVSFTLLNEEGEADTVTIDLTAEAWRTAGRSVRTSVRLDPGEKRKIDLFVPSFGDSRGSGSPSYSCFVSVGNESTYLNLRMGGATNAFHMLIATDARVRAGVSDAIAERLGETRAVKAIGPSKASASIHRGGVLVGTGLATPSSAPSVSPVSTAIATLDQLPPTYHGYTSLDVALLDIRRGLPPAEKLDPLLAWVKLGGKLVVCGPGALEVLRGLERHGALFEDRFVGTGLPAGPVFAVGHGSVLTFDLAAGAEILVEPDHVESVAALLVKEARGGWIPDPSGWRFDAKELAIPGLKRLPLRIFLILLLVFAVVIGPVNLMMIKRLARPALLLVSIPALSILSSIGILTYGILYQGIDIKARSESFTVLDQRTHDAATIERRAMFVGLSPGSGLRPEPGTAVFPAELRDESESYALDFEDGLILRGSFLPVRDPVQQMVLTRGPARSRLEFEQKDGRIELKNTFEVPVQGVVLRDPAGVLHYSRQALEPGEGVLLETADRSADPAALVAGTSDVAPLFTGLEASTYLAVLNKTVFTDDCGLDLSAAAQKHYVHGILPANMEDW